MKINLNDFINDNREAFDSYEPRDDVWKAIEEQLAVEKKKEATVRKMILIRWSAAAAILIVISSIIYISMVSKKREASFAAVTGESYMPTEYKEELYHFTKLIELKHKQLKKIEREQPGLYRQFAGDISKLDSNYQVLRNELPGHPNQEVLIQLMISNLKWQIDLLNEQLNIIQKIKQAKKINNEKIFKSA